MGRPGPLAWLSLAYLALGVAFTHPLVLHLTGALPYAAVAAPGHELVWRAAGDYLQFYYYLWLFREGLLGRAPLLRDPYQFAIGEAAWNLPGSFVPVALLFALLSPLGDLTAYNLLVLLSFPLTGLAMTAWLLRLTGSWLAGAAGGLIYALAPYRLGALLGGQPAGMSYALLPLVLLGVEGALAGRARGGLLAGAALLALAGLEPHFVYFCGFLVPTYLALRWLGPAWTPGFLAADRQAVLGATALGALLAVGAWHGGGSASARPALAATRAVVAFLLVLIAWQGVAALLARLTGAAPPQASRQALWCTIPLALPAGVVLVPGRGTLLIALGLALTFCLVARRCAAARCWRPSAAAIRAWLPFLVLTAAGMAYLASLAAGVLAEGPGTRRPLHEAELFAPRPADLLQRANPHGARAVYPGLVATGLALAGVARAARLDPGLRTLVAGAAVLTPVALGLSLGPGLRTPALYELAYHELPFFSLIRQPAKHQVLVALGLGLLAGVGTTCLVTQHRRGPWLAALVLVGTALDYHPGRPVALSALPGAAPPELAASSRTGKILYLPLWPGDSAWSSVYLHAATLTRTPMLNGYSPLVPRRYVREVARPLESLNWGELRREQAEQLRRLGVAVVVLDRGVFPPKVSPFPSALTLARLARSPWLEPAGARNPLWVFRLRTTARDEPAPNLVTSPQGVFYEAEWLPRHVGTVVPGDSASGGHLVQVFEGRPGFAAFGPYRVLPPGRYRTVFHLAGPARVEVTTDRGTWVLAQRTVPAGGLQLEDVTLEYRLAEGRAVEFRVFWPGGAPLAVDYVYTTFADQTDPVSVFEVETLAHALEEQPDAEASGGIAAVTAPLTPRDTVLTGPYRRYPPGRYVAWFRLRSDSAGGQSVARLAVREAYGRELAGREVQGSEAAGGYAEIAVGFELAAPRILEFPVVYRGGAVLYLDRIAVERAR